MRKLIHFSFLRLTEYPFAVQNDYWTVLNIPFMHVNITSLNQLFILLWLYRESRCFPCIMELNIIKGSLEGYLLLVEKIGAKSWLIRSVWYGLEEESEDFTGVIIIAGGEFEIVLLEKRGELFHELYSIPWEFSRLTNHKHALIKLYSRIEISNIVELDLGVKICPAPKCHLLVAAIFRVFPF